MEVWLHSILTSPLDGGEWSASQPGHFTSRERAHGTHWIGGGSLYDVAKKNIIPSLRLPEIEFRLSSP